MRDLAKSGNNGRMEKIYIVISVSLFMTQWYQDSELFKIRGTLRMQIRSVLFCEVTVDSNNSGNGMQ